MNINKRLTLIDDNFIFRGSTESNGCFKFYNGTPVSLSHGCVVHFLYSIMAVFYAVQGPTSIESILKGQKSVYPSS